MDGWLALVAIVLVFGATLGGLAWLASTARRRGIGTSVLGVVDEILHPAAYEPRIEVQIQDQRTDPAPAPGDPVDLSRDRR